MRFSRGFGCPKCGHRFSRRTGLSRSRFRRGFLSGVGFQCPECGTASRLAVAWLRALWAWPLAAAILYLDVFLLHHNPAIAHLRNSQPGLIFVMAGLSMVLLGVLLRIGMTLAVITEAAEAAHRSWWRRLLRLAITLAALAAFGIVSHDWRIYAFFLGVVLVLRGVSYLRVGERASERSEGPDDQGHGDDR